jgi:serine/threonine-protein kinase RsbW
VRALGVAGLGPAGVLERLDSFVEGVEPARYATVAYGEMELSTGTLHLASAGHPPPVLLRAGGEAQLLWEGRSAPVGAYRRPYARGATACRLTAGDRVLLYTDGLIERRDRRLDDELDRLVAAFARLRDTALETLVQTLAEEMVGDSRSRDDVCLLCLAYGAADSAGMTASP